MAEVVPHTSEHKIQDSSPDYSLEHLTRKEGIPVPLLLLNATITLEVAVGVPPNRKSSKRTKPLSK